MNKHLAVMLSVLAGLSSAAVSAAPGEYWEITSKMEMPGMPFAMPATTQKVCIAKGSESDPGKTSGDKDCKMTDIKTVGNKTTWKARCVKDGEVMTGTGEQTTSAGAYQGKIRFKGRSGGEDMDMSMVYSGKKVGGRCDTGEAARKIEAEGKRIKSQICDTSQYENTAQWMAAAPSMIFQPGAACADQRSQFCATVKKDASRDAKTYAALVQSEQTRYGNISIVKECRLNMASTTRSVCKTLNGHNYRDLSAHCPAEAKKYRETARRKECEGRSYTAETRAADLKKCLSGDDGSSDDDDGDEPAPAKSRKSGSPASDALEGAKKLKGLFGF